MTKDIINKFKECIFKQDLTQTQAAEKIGCTQEHLCRILNGTRNPSAKLLDKMEEVVNEYEE